MDDTNQKPDKKAQGVTGQLQIGVDWDKNLVLIQPQAEGMPAYGIPLDVYLSSAANLMQQMLLRIAKASQSGIIIAHPGQVPGDPRKLN